MAGLGFTGLSPYNKKRRDQGHHPARGNVAGSVDVIDRLSILCFAGTYGLALVAELARFVVRGAVRWYLAAVLMALGWLVQTAFLANLAMKHPMAPITTPFGSIMLLSWIVA